MIKVLEVIDKNILLVEDETIARIVAHKLLNDLGYMPTVVENGKDAIQSTQNKDYHLILMDIGLPDMDGFAATTAIRKSHPTLPIIALTAFPPEDIAEQCQKAGITQVLRKPIDKSTLNEVLQKYL